MKTFAIFEQNTKQIICIFNAAESDAVDVTNYANLEQAHASMDCYVINQEEQRFDLRPDYEAYKLAMIENDVRNKRNMLLLKSDWTQNPDVNVDREAWANYRAALRDISQQSGFPTDIIWPEEPN